MEGGCPGKRWQGLNPGSGLDEWLTEISDNIEKRWEVRGSRGQGHQARQKSEGSGIVTRFELLL